MIDKWIDRIVIGGGAIIVLVTIVLIVIIGLEIKSKNKNLAGFAKQIEELALPPATIQLGKTYKRVGLLTGNGNHCDYAAAKLVKSQLSKEEIEKFYFSNKFSNAESGSIQQFFPVKLEVIKAAEIGLNTQIGSTFHNNQDKIEQFSINENDLEMADAFIIGIVDNGYPASDIRCH